MIEDMDEFVDKILGKNGENPDFDDKNSGVSKKWITYQSNDFFFRLTAEKEYMNFRKNLEQMHKNKKISFSLNSGVYSRWNGQSHYFKLEWKYE